MRKKLNIFALALLIFGQTILGPIATVSASGIEVDAGESAAVEEKVQDVSEDETRSTDPVEPTETDKPAEPEKPAEQPEPTEPAETPGQDGEAGSEESPGKDSSDGSNKGEGESGKSSDSTDTSKPSDEEDEEKALTEEEEEDSTRELMGDSGFDPQDITRTLKSVEYTINDVKVTGPMTDLSQDATVKGTFVFKGNTEAQDDTAETGSWVKGSSFTFDLPPTLIDYNNSFKSTGVINGADGIKFTYATEGNKVTVTLAEDAPNPTPDQEFTITFTSGFTLVGNEVEQELAIPQVGGGSEKISLTFVPKLTGKNVTKEQDGNIEIANGERIISWEAWVNKAGKQLTNATVTDNPTGTDGAVHEVVSGSVNVEQHTVKLDGSTELVVANYITDDDFNLDLDDGKHAYKITYKTKVTGDNLSGKKDLSNKIILTNNGQEDGNATVNTSTTYGTALKKNKDTNKTNNNYTSNWEIIYNYNLAPILEDSAVITDTLTGSHKIKEDSIKVYPVTVDDSGNYQSKGTALTVGSGYTINFNGTDNKFTINFHADNDDGDKVTKAYKVEYEAKYTDQDFFDSKDPETITNVVVSDAHLDVPEKDRKDTHTLTENIITKSHQVDKGKDEIIWTITVNNADSATDINGLVITDTFDEEAKHTLVGGLLGITDGTNGTPALIGDLEDGKGFTITGGSVPAGESKTITYRTAYEILPNGSVHANGYKNIANATWASDKPYSITKEDIYKPAATSTNNGSKSGSFNYKDQEFTWNIKINTNKADLAGATLTDILGPGHKIVPESFRVCVDNLGIGGDEIDKEVTPCTEATNLTTGYKIDSTDTTFTLTFDTDFIGKDITDKTAYVVTYKTVDNNDILGIESTDDTALESSYSNTATFTTKVNGIDSPFPFTTTPVPVKNANELLSKKVSAGNTVGNTTGTLTWQAEVNKSHSKLGNVVFEDKPSEKLMILPDTVQYRKMIINETNGNISYGSTTANPWINALDAGKLTINPDGSFEINLGSLNKEGYLVEYQTYVLGKEGEAFNNEAKIQFGFSTANNQKDDAKVSDDFKFSKSDANASATKGKVNLKKVGYNPATGETIPLEEVTFKLMKKVGNNNRLIAEGKSDVDGNLSFENVYYGTYFIEEVAAPNGYKLAQSGKVDFIMSATTDTSLPVNADKVVEIVNDKIIPPGAMCDKFTLTVKNENDETRENVRVKFVQNDNDVFVLTTNTNSNGKILIDQTDLPAGLYKVVEIDANGDTIKELGSVQVKYQDGCQDEVQPAPSCPEFTITVKGENDIVRPNVKVTVKEQNTNPDNEVATGTTDNSGQITVPYKDLPAGTYDVYENEIFLGEIVVTYIGTDKCQAEVDLTVPNAGTCPVFTLTVNDRSGKGREDIDVIVKNSDETIVETGKTGTGVDAGKVTFPNVIEPGTYTVYEVNANGSEKRINTFKVTTDCEADVKPRPATGGGGTTPPQTCDAFTVTVKQHNVVVGADVELTLKSGSTEVATGKTDATGKIVFDKADLPAGSYTAYDKEGNDVGTITVSYDEDECQAVVNMTPNTCDVFTVTVKENGKPVGEEVALTVKDKDGKTVTTGKTDKDGKIVFEETNLPAGEYTVYDEEDNEVGTITVSYDGNCEDEVNLTPNTCDVFTVTVKENGKPVGEDVALTVKDKDGKTVTTGKTDKDGKIVFEETDLPAGEHTVYDEEDNEVGTITVSYDGNCEDEVNLTPNTCDVFTVTVKENGKPVGKDVELTVKDKDGKEVTTGKTDKDGKIVFEEDKLPAGEYTVYDEEDNEVSTITVTYEGNCEGEVNLTPNTCDVFTVTVKENGKPVEAHTALILKDATGKNVAAGSTDADGKITFDKVNLPEGSYTAYDKDDNAFGTVIVSYDQGECEAVVDSQPQTQACDAFTITVKQSGEVVGADISLTLKDDAGKTVATGKTDKDGKIVFDKADLPEGSYKAYDGDDKEVGTVIVSYNEDKCQAVVDLQVKACETFTLTVTDKPNADVSLKDANGETVVEGKTDADEKVIFTKPIPEGTYTVFVDGEEIGKIVVTDTCTGNIAGSPSNPDPGPGSGGGGGGSCGIACSGGGTPVDPPTGPTDPEKPVGPPTGPTDPEKPVGPPTGPTDPEKPVDPPTGPTDPEKPVDPPTGPTDPEKPVDPPTGPTDPNKPGTGTDTDEKPGTGVDTDTDEKPGTGIGTETDKKPENKLPQTGEAFPVGPMAGGFAAIALGMWLLLRRTKVRQTP